LVTLPFVFLLLDFWPLGRLGSLRTGKPESAKDHNQPVRQPRTWRLLAEKLPFFALSAAFSVIALSAQRSGRAISTLTAVPLVTRLLNALVAYVAYFGDAIVPHHLAVYYAHPVGAISWPAIVGSLILIVAVSAAVMLLARRLPFLFVGWAWYVGTLVPMIGIVQIGSQQRADRYTYFPLIGIYVAMAWLIPELVRGRAVRSWVLPASGTIYLALLAAVSFVQIGHWRDSVTLFRSALEAGWDNPLIRSSLGSALVARGEMTEGMRYLESAVRIPPPDARAEFNLAVALQDQGRLNEATEHYHAGLALDEGNADAHNNLGIILSQRHQYHDAKRQFARAIELDADHAQACLNLATLCEELGEHAEAIEYSQRGLQLDPTLLRCHLNIALALRAQGHFDEAIHRLKYLLSIAPGDQEARAELARTLDMKRRSSGS
jgi:protein O-mannosyl-transferase